MKIDYTGYPITSEMDIEGAVKHYLRPDAYSYEGTIERLEAKIDKLQDVVAKLVEIVINEDDRLPTDAEKVKHVLGYYYEVKE